MRTRFVSTCFILPLMALGVFATSCDNDDNKDNEIPPVQTPDRSVVGDYKGVVKMAYEGAESGFGEADVTARVDADNLYFDEFPIKGIIEAIVGEEDAAGIIEAVGKISYQIAYTSSEPRPEPQADAEPIEMEFTPEPLKITIPGESALEVEVTVSSPEKGIYDINDSALDFILSVDAVSLNGVPMPEWQTIILDFSLNKQKSNK